MIALLSSYLLHLLALLSKISWVSVDFGSVRPCRNTILPKNHQPIFLWSLFSFIVAVKMRDLCGAVSVRDAVENSKQLCEKKMSLKRTLGLGDGPLVTKIHTSDGDKCGGNGGTNEFCFNWYGSAMISLSSDDG